MEFKLNNSSYGDKRCCVPHCNSSGLTHHMHCFPRDINRRRAWLDQIFGIGFENPSSPKVKNRLVCHDHFDSASFTKSCKRVKSGALPTINLSEPHGNDSDHNNTEPRVVNTIKDNDDNTIEDYHDDITHEEETCVSSSKGQVPQKDRLKHCLKDLDIREKKIKMLCDDINMFSNHSLTDKAQLIDRFYTWLTDLKMSDSQRTICVNILMEYREMWPEVANHPLLLQRILTPKDSTFNGGIFDEKLFNEHIKPLIVELYKSREMKVRLQLLDSLQNYIFVYTEEEVKMILLPEILIGMQDSDKIVVRATLISLAQLVDVLGPTAVIGGQSQDIFVQTEVAARETVEKATDLDEPQSCLKEENKDSANESEEERDPLDLREVKCRKGRKRKKRIEIESKDDESETELDSANSDKHIMKHDQNIQSYKRRPRISLNESEEEQDTLDVQERITNTYTEVEYLDCESGTELDLVKEVKMEHDKPIQYKKKSQRHLNELSGSQFSNRSNSKDVSALSKTRSSSFKRKQILTKGRLLKDDSIS